jgi:PKD repeat protein/spore germination protein YaaH
MKKLLSFVLFSISLVSFSQNHQSIHQIQLEHYNALGYDANYYENFTPFHPSNNNQQKYNGCALNKMVYGWHPYWAGNDYLNYEWDLLSHLSFFSYEVDKNTGNATTTHGWSTSAAVDAALASGNTKVTLCVTLFGSSNLTTFLTNSIAKQTLISNLISTIQSRGAHGVNIDFEGLPSSQKTNFANFMVDLSNQMHAAIPGSEVSSVLYAVDWNNVFDFSIMLPAVDYFVVMGYDYYYPGSSNTGPSDPLYQFGNSYNFTLSKTITDYINAGCSKDKLLLGLPYYGFEWETVNSNIPSATTANGIARTYSLVKNNSSGNYSAANHNFDNDSYTDIYVYQQGGVWKQCYISEKEAFSKRLQHVNNSGIAGIGIWALGYDDGYDDYWWAINDFLTDCKEDSCSGIIHDFGGPTKNYYNNEDYTWTIAPTLASTLTVNFTTFDIEQNYDTLWVYDGNSTASTLIGAYTGTNSPGSFTISSGAVTFRFKSDGATVAPGFNATYSCMQDNVAPNTAINLPNNWETGDFNVAYTDNDDNQLANAFHLISDNDGQYWSANFNNGFMLDSFEVMQPTWTSVTGNWQIAGSQMYQSDEAENNSNIYTNLWQDNQYIYLYHWIGQLQGTGTNRRAGIHFWCNDATQTQRGDSYMVYWRADQDKCQIYKSTANTIVLQTDDAVVVDPNVTYDFKIMFNPQTGNIKAFLDDVLVSEWTDASPFTSGNHLSLRTGNCIGIYDNFKVYHSRSNTELVSVGLSINDVRYQNQNPITPSASVQSIVVDEANNFSTIAQSFQNIDWTIPETNGSISDGLGADINTFNTPNEISGNWTAFVDTNSAIAEYWYAVGTSTGGTDIVNWTNNSLNQSFTETGLSLTVGTTYYVSVKAINGAGLESIIISSDGQTLQSGSIPPIAGFTSPNTFICEGDGITFNNTSTNAINFLWDFGNGTTSTDINPTVYYTNNGTYTVTLTAYNGSLSDQTTQTINVNLSSPPAPNFTTSSPTIYPNTTIYFTNSSQNANTYYWNFGDGNNSSDTNPWHAYSSIGTFTVTLTASNSICPDSSVTQIVEIATNIGLSENQANHQIVVFPNPFNDVITINAPPNTEMINVQIFDTAGKIVYQNSINQQQKTINLNYLSNGYYIIELNFNHKIEHINLIKQ